MSQPAVPEAPAPAADARAARRTGLAYMGATALLYGSLWPVMRVAVARMEPFWFGVARLVVGALALFLLLALLRRLRLPGRGDLAAIVYIGVFMMGFYAALVHVGLQYVPAGRGALLGYSMPLWVPPAAALLLGERLTRRTLLGLAAGLAGLAVLFNPAALDWSDRRVLLGNGLLLLAAISWSVAILGLRRHRWRLSPLQLAPWQLLLAALIVLVPAVVVEGAPELRAEPELVFLIAYGGVFGTGIALAAATSAMRLLPATVAAIGFLGGPVVALAISALFLGEAVTPSLALGVVLILAGVLLVSLAPGQAD